MIHIKHSITSIRQIVLAAHGPIDNGCNISAVKCRGQCTGLVLGGHCTGFVPGHCIKEFVADSMLWLWFVAR